MVQNRSDGLPRWSRQRGLTRSSSWPQWPASPVHWGKIRIPVPRPFGAWAICRAPGGRRRGLVGPQGPQAKPVSHCHFARQIMRPSPVQRSSRARRGVLCRGLKLLQQMLILPEELLKLLQQLLQLLQHLLKQLQQQLSAAAEAASGTADVAPALAKAAAAALAASAASACASAIADIDAATSFSST